MIQIMPMAHATGDTMLPLHGGVLASVTFPEAAPMALNGEAYPEIQDT